MPDSLSSSSPQHSTSPKSIEEKRRRRSGDLSPVNQHDSTPPSESNKNKSPQHYSSPSMRNASLSPQSNMNNQKSLKTFSSIGPAEKRLVKRPSSVAQAFNSNFQAAVDGQTSHRHFSRRPSRRLADGDGENFKREGEPLSCISLDPNSTTIPLSSMGSAVFAPRPNQRPSPLSSRANNVLLSSKNKDYDGLVKLLLLGDSAVGKSSLLLRFCTGNFELTHVLTIGVDFKSKIVLGDEDERIKLQIWDTAGQERFRNLTPVYFRTAMGVVLVFDVTSLETFRNISYWMKNLEDLADQRTMRILVGNKIDLPNRQVTREDGEELAQRYGLKYFETSAKTNEYVDEAFVEIARDIRRHQKDGSPIGPPLGNIKLTVDNTTEANRTKSASSGFKGFASCCYSY